jgi:serine/threonine protein kinase
MFYLIFLSRSYIGHPTSEQLEEFFSEISTMKRVGKHPNIVRLLGSCTVEQNLMMVMEYVPCGDLVCFLFMSIY